MFLYCAPVNMQKIKKILLWIVPGSEFGVAPSRSIRKLVVRWKLRYVRYASQRSISSSREDFSANYCAVLQLSKMPSHRVVMHQEK